MKNRKPISFSLQKISIIQYALIFEPKESELIEFSFLAKVGHNRDNRIIAITAEFKFSQDQNIFIQLETMCQFEISEESWKTLPRDSNDNIIIEKGFIAHCTSLIIGTSRGILYSKTEGTPFNKYLIPLINIPENNEDYLVTTSI